MFKTVLAVLLCAFFAASVSAQTTAFTYQGSMQSSGSPANGNFDLEFKLFDLVSGGVQQGSTQQQLNVPVANGIFTVSLDFGSGTLPGADRFLDIAVRTAGGGAFTALSPRQKLNSAPYSVRSLNSAAADVAANATQLGGIAANQYVVTTDPRMTDARPPTAGSTNYIQNGVSQQASANFNVSGMGTASVFNAGTQFNLNGSRILTNAGTNNLFAGINSGTANSNGSDNSFFGTSSGQANTGGLLNSFFGAFSGQSNTNGLTNSLFGYSSGGQNSTGGANSFFGASAGFANTTGNSNSFFGASSGFANTTGSNNILIGSGANVGAGNLSNAGAIGSNALVAQSNSLVLGGINGVNNATADTNVGIGTTIPAHRLQVIRSTPGVVIHAENTAIGLPGAGVWGVSKNGPGLGFGGIFEGGSEGVRGFAEAGTSAAEANGVSGLATGSAGARNGILGRAFGDSTAFASGVYGRADGPALTNYGVRGSASGAATNYGVYGEVFGSGNNNFAGYFGGKTIVIGSFGVGLEQPLESVQISTSFGNTISLGDPGCGPTFAAIGFGAFGSSMDGCSNYALMGDAATTVINRPSGGQVNFRENNVNQMTIASGGNVGIGTTAPTSPLTVGVPEATTATAGVGVYSTVGTNIVVRETTNDVENIFGANITNGGLFGTTTNHNVTFRTNNTNRLRILSTGEIVVFNLGAAGATSLCLNGSSQISSCSSSLRYKSHIGRFAAGLSIINRLKPISFDWKDGGMKDVGFGAEDVAKIDARFVTYNDKGEVEGVKYDRLSVAFVNAFKEQQAQIQSQRTQIEKQQAHVESQQRQIDEQRGQIQLLLRLACSQTSERAVCRQ